MSTNHHILRELIYRLSSFSWQPREGLFTRLPEKLKVR
jgi:hypothetical protein